MFGCRRCCGVFLLVDERCASQSPKSRRVRQDVGDVVEVPGIPPHLHFAIAERRGGTNFRIDIFDLLIVSMVI
jgi:hypothetical protein